ncbi:MAG: homoserine O-succinyltransferase [Synergistaceae bacterium]|jgi:homoserine O-succinyltransferase|nr:homoserine O-succinyltransferase [Synergistaceae bacterium]
MPIKVPNDLPAAKILARENVIVITEQRATRQDIRPIRIAALNLMPNKSDTELQLLRLLGGTPLQVEVDFLHVASHISKNTPLSHLEMFYKTFECVRGQCYDGMIITGAPVEMLPFEEVDYWPELSSIMEWSKYNVYSTFHICWGAQAGLYYHYGMEKYLLDQKLSGVFAHCSIMPTHPLLWGFDDVYYAPHSRYTTIRAEDLRTRSQLRLISHSKDAGAYIIVSVDGRKIFVTGHSEYDRLTLANEYARDAGMNIAPRIPLNYFPNDDSKERPVMRWSAHANLLFRNWINFMIYPNTPYDLASLCKMVMRPRMTVM